MRILKVQMLRDAQRLVEIVSVFVNEDSGEICESYNIYHPARYWSIGMSKTLYVRHPAPYLKSFQDQLREKFGCLHIQPHEGKYKYPECFHESDCSLLVLETQPQHQASASLSHDKENSTLSANYRQVHPN